MGPFFFPGHGGILVGENFFSNRKTSPPAPRMIDIFTKWPPAGKFWLGHDYPHENPKITQSSKILPLYHLIQTSIEAALFKGMKFIGNVRN